MAGMSVRDFYDSTLGEVLSIIKHNTDLKVAESKERWLVGRSIAYCTIRAMGGEVEYAEIPYFPEFSKAETAEPDRKAVKAMIEKMDRAQNDPGMSWEIHKPLKSGRLG
jgi:hypothetical protein